MILTNYVDKVKSIFGNDLVCYYPLDKDHYSGGQFLDASGNGYNMTNSVLTFDGTLSLDGRQIAGYNGASSTSMTDSGAYADLNLEEVTIMAHVKANSGWWTSGGSCPFVRVQGDSDNNIYMSKGSANETIALIHRGDDPTYVQTYRNFTISTLDWFIFIGTWSIANDYMRLYINNTLQNSVSGLQPPSVNPTLLNVAGLGGNILNGYMAHVAIAARPIDVSDANSIIALSMGYKY